VKRGEVKIVKKKVSGGFVYRVLGSDKGNKVKVVVLLQKFEATREEKGSGKRKENILTFV